MDPIEIHSHEELDIYLQELFGSHISPSRSRWSLQISPERGRSGVTPLSKSQELFSSVSFQSLPTRDPGVNHRTMTRPSLPENNNDHKDSEKQSTEDDNGEVGRTSGVVNPSEEGPSNKKVQDPEGWRRFIGLGLALLACLAFSLSSLIVKYFSEYHPFTKCVWRFHGLIIPVVPMMIYCRCIKKEPIFDTICPPCVEQRWKNLIFLLLRAAAGFGTIIFQFYALHYISLADQLVIVSSQPVFVTIVAFFMLGERTGVVPIVMCFITIIGVAIVTKPPILTGADAFDNDVLVGTGFSLASMAMSVGSIVFMRRLKEVHFTLILLAFAVFSMIAAGISAAVLGVLELPHGRDHVILAVIMAGLVFVAQFCTTMALKYEQAGLVSLTRATTIVFAFAWQFIFFGIVPDRFSIIGASIITFAVALVAVRKWLSTLPEKDGTRRSFAFLLK